MSISEKFLIVRKHFITAFGLLNLNTFPLEQIITEMIIFCSKTGHVLSYFLTDYSMTINSIGIIPFAVYRTLRDRQHYNICSVTIYKGFIIFKKSEIGYLSV